MATKSQRTEFTIKTIRVLRHSRYGYDGSGVFPLTDNYFYLATDENDKVYTIGTSKTLYEGDTIKASVVGENDYNGVHQTKLTRVSLITPGPNRPEIKNNVYINCISTDGEYY